MKHDTNQDSTRIVRPIDMQMVKEYLQENLEINIRFKKSHVYWEEDSIEVVISLEGENICDSYTTIE